MAQSLASARDEALAKWLAQAPLSNIQPFKMTSHFMYQGPLGTMCKYITRNGLSTHPKDPQ